MKKACSVCGKIQDIEFFRKRLRMKDGHYKQCHGCIRKRDREYLYKKRMDIVWYMEFKRKARLRTAKNRKPLTPEYRKFHDGLMRRKFPNKVKARAASRYLLKKGLHAHHWSYLPEHTKDVIMLSRKDHDKIHCYMKYDEVFSQYRTLSGSLLDTKELALLYYESLGDKD